MQEPEALDRRSAQSPRLAPASTRPLRIYWFAWKDIRHPDAGGAEVVMHDWLCRLKRDGHDVLLVTARYPGAEAHGDIDGVPIVRVGRNRYTHYWAAVWYYLRHLRHQADLLVEEVNTVPYLLSLVSKGERVLLFYPQLAREIWFYQMPAVVGAVGYVCEAVYTWIQGRFRKPVVTISDDSKNDLLRFGFDGGRIGVVPLGIENTALTRYDAAAKEHRFTVLYHSSLRPMKRPMEALRAFAEFRQKGSDGQLWMSGGGDASSLRAFARERGVESDVVFFGKTTVEQKLDLMRRATVLVSTSVKEGWGLIVTEANSMGTPAVVYDVDGLRHAARSAGNSVVPSQSSAMASKLADMARLFTTQRTSYDKVAEQALEGSRRFTLEGSYQSFAKLVVSEARHV